MPHVVVINDASVARGGATGLALLSARMLRMRGHRVTYICGDGGDDGALAAQGVQVVALGGTALLKRGKFHAARRGLYDAAKRDGLARAIAEIDGPDTVYHLHGWAQILSPSVFDALAPVAAHTFLHAHDYFLACPNGAYFDYQRREECARVPMSASCLATNCDRRSRAQKTWRSMRQMQVRRGLAGRDWAGVLQIHPGMRDSLARGGLPEAAIRTVRNPVERWSETRIPAETNRRLAYVGRLEVGKGVALLCEAARRAGLPLRVIGSAENRKELTRAYPEVEFAGWTPRDEIAAAVADCRALVMPSRFAEPFGLVGAEASLSGLPVAISRAALLAPDVVAAGLGTAVDVSGPDSLARDLLAFMDRPDDEIEAMSRAGFAGEGLIAQTPGAWIDQLSGLYDAALAAAR
ncbi:glycosyltransferase [Jannaschia seohaensis]|uniref:Glycosyltransferase involved in cell wall biosynthesis n=1 Tax=Jannaschia seohaensis TaxID=475081 RepID=A0A2Y9A779_9RHOB|nr:glycosyltransferase [Jannaschia seohaensis]PWJ22171.1 glycosyltransferase involved in cell wall biosynthesis [Jannaschia seohaensis]SSA38449.1 Glycosyltransferase involved in cell wall bisynthesis [Jannaschia seohaensis]